MKRDRNIMKESSGQRDQRHSEEEMNMVWRAVRLKKEARLRGRQDEQWLSWGYAQFAPRSPLKWFLSSQKPAECCVQTICFRKRAGQTHRDSQALIHRLGLQSRTGSSEQAFPTEPGQ